MRSRQWVVITLVCGLLATGGCARILGFENFTVDAGELDGSVEGQAPAPDGSIAADASTEGSTRLPLDAGPDATGDAESPDDEASTTCVSSGSCTAGACETGQWSCPNGAAVCMATGNVEAGTPCASSDGGVDHVCSASGTCVTCQGGQDCSEAGACQIQSTDCRSGAPVCVEVQDSRDGTSCGASTGTYCYGGQCKACTVGASCPPAVNVCNKGTTTCPGGVAQCTDTGTAAAAGLPCKTATVTSGVCDGNGACVACSSGASCNPQGNTCKSGTASCSSGFVCNPGSAVNQGLPCGTGSICSSGSCLTCNATTCPNGCCDAHGCVTRQTTSECGTGAGGGACRACTAPSGGTVQCTANNCASSCPSSEHPCGSSCVSNTDTNNCGTACGTNCQGPSSGTGSAACNGNTCAIKCTSGTACGTACVDTTGDANNCGVCGKSCRGAGCASSLCQALTVIAQYTPLAIAVDSTQIYWANGGSQSGIFKASLNSPSSTVTEIGTDLAEAYATPMGLAVGGGNVYWNSMVAESNGNLDSVPVTSTGGTTATVIAAKPFVGVAVDPSGNVYWTASGGTIMKRTQSSGVVSTLYSVGSGNAYGVAADASNVYWTDQFDGNVYKVPSNGTGSLTTLATSLAEPSAIAIDGANAYFLVTNGVMGVPLAGTSAAKTLATDNNVSTQESGIATDGTYVYWSNQSALMRVPVGGGAATDMGVGAALFGVTVDSNYVYFVSFDPSNGVYNIEKVAR